MSSKKTMRYVSMMALALPLLFGCAGSKKAAVSPVAGSWSYIIATPDGDYDGSLNLAGTPDLITGTMVSASEGDASYPMEDISFEKPVLNLTIVHSQFGRLTVTANVEGDSMEGTISVPGYGEMPLRANRVSAE